MKVCHRCRLEKPEDEFGKNKANPDGLDHYCKECRRAYKQEHVESIRLSKEKYRTAHREELNEKKRASYVPHPIIKKSEEEKAETRKAYYQAHRQEKLEYTRQYQEANREKCRQLSEDWQRRHPEKAAEYKKRSKERDPEAYKLRHKAMKQRRRARLKGNGGSYTREDLQVCLQYFKGCCAYTGEPLEPEFHLDHVVPLAKGGTNDIHNIVPCNRVPNIDKSDKDLIVWYKTKDYYRPERLARIEAWTLG